MDLRVAACEPRIEGFVDFEFQIYGQFTGSHIEGLWTSELVFVDVELGRLRTSYVKFVDSFVDLILRVC